MSSKSEKLSELRKLTFRAVDDQLDPDEKKSRESLLSEDYDLVREYVSAVTLQSMIGIRYRENSLPFHDTENDKSAADNAGMERVRKDKDREKITFGSQPARQTAFRLVAIAATVCAALAWWQFSGVDATIAGFHEVTWDHDFGYGDSVNGEWLNVKRGEVRLEFTSGASVSIDGPARFRTISGKKGELEFGRISAIVPSCASGFAVVTPNCEIVDLGTGFHLAIDQSSTGSVHVTSGKIRIDSDDSESITVEAGQIAHLSETAKLDTRVPVTKGSISYHEEHVESLSYRDFQSTGEAFVFLENHDLVLPHDVAVNASTPGSYSNFETDRTVVPKDTKVDCYLVHTAPEEARHIVNGSIKFPGKILGVICDSDRLNASNYWLGADWTLRCNHHQRGLESKLDRNSDNFRIHADGQTVSISLKTELAIDQFRVLVASE